jgi:predicted nuclease of predicted toxin-antitoxin system
MADLFADEDFSKDVVKQLRRFGHDVVTIQEAGWANKPGGVEFSDRDVLDYASRLDRAVLTCNDKDFEKEHHRTLNHPGIIACPQTENPVELAHQIHQRLQQELELKRKFVDLKTGRTLSHAIGPAPPEPSRFQQIMKEHKPPSGNTLEKKPSPTLNATPSASPSRFREVMNHPAQPQPPSPTSPQKPKTQKPNI